MGERGGDVSDGEAEGDDVFEVEEVEAEALVDDLRGGAVGGVCFLRAGAEVAVLGEEGCHFLGGFVLGGLWRLLAVW